MPPEKVEVADDVFKIEPPVMVRPCEREAEVPARPPEKVDVAVLVFKREPAVIVRPADEESPAVAIPPEKVDVPVESEMMVPVAVKPATFKLPENRPSPWTEKFFEGVVVPRPNEPVPSSRKPSVRVPARKVEKARLDEPVR